MRREVDEEFAQYVRARQHRLLRAAFLVCGDTHLAEELVGDALAKLATRWSRLRTEDPEAYVRRTLYRDAVSSWRRTRRDSLDLHLEPLADDGGPLGGVDERIDLERALELLTPRQRAVVVLRFFEDRTEADTAEALGVSTRLVRSQTDAAVAALRAVMPGLTPAGGELS
jgi:RNA polymerase sigma-70 factor (sigma-E family)